MGNGNPAPQVITASSGTPPLVVIGCFGVRGGISGWSFSPTQDGSITFNDIAMAHKIYNSSPADVTIDMADLGNVNTLISCYLQVA